MNKKILSVLGATMVLAGGGELGLSFPGDSAGAAAAEVEKLDVMKMTQADIDAFYREFFDGCDLDGSGKVNKHEVRVFLEAAMSALPYVKRFEHDCIALDAMEFDSWTDAVWGFEEFKSHAGQYLGSFFVVEELNTNLNLIRSACVDARLFNSLSPFVYNGGGWFGYAEKGRLLTVLASFLPTTGIHFEDDWTDKKIHALQQAPADASVLSYRQAAGERGTEAQVTFPEFHGLMNALREKGADVSGLRAHIAASAGAAS